MVYHCGFHPRLLGGLNAQFCFDVQRESIIIISWYFAWKWCKNGVPGSSTCNMSSISIQLIYHDVVILFPTSFFGIFMINMVNYVKKTIDHVKPYRWSWSRARPICLEGTNAPLNYSAKKEVPFLKQGLCQGIITCVESWTCDAHLATPPTTAACLVRIDEDQRFLATTWNKWGSSHINHQVHT